MTLHRDASMRYVDAMPGKMNQLSTTQEHTHSETRQ